MSTTSPTPYNFFQNDLERRHGKDEDLLPQDEQRKGCLQGFCPGS